MPVQILNIPLHWLHLELRNLAQIILIIDAITQHIAKISQRPLQSISRTLLFCLLKCCRLALTILNMPIPHIFMKSSILQGNSHNDRKAQADFECCSIFIHKVDLCLNNLTRPAIESEHFVGKLNTFLCCDIMNLLPGWSCA